jgi:hypothetical protein
LPGETLRILNDVYPQVRDVRMFWGNSSGWNKIMVAMSDEMVKALEQERKGRKLESIPETVRAVLGEYFKRKDAS